MDNLVSLQGSSGLNLFRHCGSVRLACYLTSAQPAGQIWIIGNIKAHLPQFHPYKITQILVMISDRWLIDSSIADLSSFRSYFIDWFTRCLLEERLIELLIHLFMSWIVKIVEILLIDYHFICVFLLAENIKKITSFRTFHKFFFYCK